MPEFKMKVTPRFKTKKLWDETVQKDWFKFQERALVLGYRTLRYMKSYINANRKREGGSGNLAKSVDFVKEAGAGLGRIFWGIGSLDRLNTRAPYWYVVNSGKTVSGSPYIPARGGFVPGYFRGGDGRPKAEYAGKGREHFDYQSGAGSGIWPTHPIRPINYIQASQVKMELELTKILQALKRGQ